MVRGSNILAESRAILESLQLCVTLGYTKVQLQSDSMVVTKWIKKETYIPGSLRPLWSHIHHFVGYKESNYLVDHLSKLGNIHKGQ
ncbi:hypothetical protein FRX31_032495, partial [Thalictrum thalictroides]